MSPSKKTFRKKSPPKRYKKKIPLAKKISPKNETSTETNQFPIVGIGASAGGLEALMEFFKELPANTGMAFVIIQHLDPTHESLSPAIIGGVTKMPVHEVEDKTLVQANHVYVIPPDFSMAIFHRTLGLLPRSATRAPHMVIDFFFQSLAQDEKQRAIGVILSGTANDGTQGLLAIKAEGGVTCAQKPSSAKYDGMPRSAIAAGVVDLILDPAEMAKELTRLARHPYIAMSQTAQTPVDLESTGENPDESLRKIFILLRSQTHVDFSRYKYTTIKRRIARRIVVNKLENTAEYANFLQKHPDEVKYLFNDILINVTGFFRDPETFKALKSKLFPALFKHKPAGTPMRIWVAGCSTGEEVYSLAISLIEYLGEKAAQTPMQIFATDISERAIQKARTGYYSDSLTCLLSKVRLNQFFERVEGGHRVKKQIRDMCLFSRHDVTSDPPFSKLDLISCRNLLIYFSPELQKHIIPIFHFSLNPHGFLLLGRSEGNAGFSNLFHLEDKSCKIYSRLSTTKSLPLHFPASTFTTEMTTENKAKPLPKKESDFQNEADKIVLSEYAPPGAVVNENMDVIQLRGRTGPFLDPEPGPLSQNLLKLARKELVSSLRMAILIAKKSNETAQQTGLEFDDEGQKKSINIKVVPINPLAPLMERKYLVLFEQVTVTERSLSPSLRGDRKTKRAGRPPIVATDDLKSGAKLLQQRIERLEAELRSSQEHHGTLASEYDATKEELTLANEELQSTNEEFQSTNEELETAKEELQSANEELTTVNDELQNRNGDLTSINNDLTNLLGAVEIPIVMVGNDHRIRRFTPKAAIALNLIATDIGRPISDIRTNFEIDIDAWVSEVIETLTLKEVEIQDRQGHWNRVQIRPYKTIDSKIDGAVLSFIDIDFLKQSLKDVQLAKGEAEKANRAKDLFIATLSHELRTPLTAILSWGQLLQSGRLNSEKSKEAINRIVDSGNSQAQLISDLLDVSRIVIGKISLQFSEVDPTEILLTAIESIRPTAKGKAIEIETKISKQHGKILADRVRVQQVFWNLLTNAVKFSPNGSKILVTSERVKHQEHEQAKILISVIDSGKGIKSEFLPHVFDSFSQEDNSSVRAHGGLGLGLAIVKNLVELHGGTVAAESLGESQGASFTVVFPLVAERPSPKTHTPAIKNKGPITSGSGKFHDLRVLLVDDEANTREAISELLISLGAETRAVSSAREAIDVFQKFKPHVLISDIAMPKEDGYFLIKAIRSLEVKNGRQVPAVAMTAFAGSDDVKRALAAGFQVHLAKPFDVDHFTEVLAKVAGKE